MKTMFTLLFATALSSSAFAYNDGKLTITLVQNRNLQVQIDGRTYNDDDNTITVRNIQAGYHTIRIYRSGNNRNGNGRWGDRNNRRSELIYSGQVYVKPDYHVDVMVNRFGKALVDERLLDRNDDDGYYNGGNGNNGGHGQVMSDYEFNQLLGRIKGQWFNSSKMNTAKENIPAYWFNTSQVRQLLQVFSSDNDKLELAKLAYRYTVDQRNYYSLYDVFSFQSSRDELEQYIRNYR
jgi:hypothetical protein